MEKNPIFEAVKEGARYAVFGGVSLFVSFLLNRFTHLPQNDAVVAVSVLILRVVDKYLHERRKTPISGKRYINNPSGILPF